MFPVAFSPRKHLVSIWTQDAAKKYTSTADLSKLLSDTSCLYSCNFCQQSPKNVVLLYCIEKEVGNPRWRLWLVNITDHSLCIDEPMIQWLHQYFRAHDYDRTKITLNNVRGTGDSEMECSPHIRFINCPWRPSSIRLSTTFLKRIIVSSIVVFLVIIRGTLGWRQTSRL